METNHGFLRSDLVPEQVGLEIEHIRKSLGTDVDLARQTVDKKTVGMRFPRDVAPDRALAGKLVQGLIDDKNISRREHCARSRTKSVCQLHQVAAKVPIQMHESMPRRVPFWTVLDNISDEYNNLKIAPARSRSRWWERVEQ